LLSLLTSERKNTLHARALRTRSEVKRLETATLLLATALRERHDTNEASEIVTIVKDALEKSASEHRHHGLRGLFRRHAA
jgi:hypothetical protein